MKLTPLDIRKQEFKRSMRGFDSDEVEAFLGMVADELELLIREKNQANDELIKLRTQLKDYQRVEQTLRDTLVKAHNTVEDTRANSRREAEIIIHEAELQADNIIKEAKEDLFRLRNEISFVKAQKESFAKRLKHLLESQIELLNVLEMEDEEPAIQAQKDSRFFNRPRKPQPLQEKPAAPQQSYSRPPIIINDNNNEEKLKSRPQTNQDFFSSEKKYSEAPEKGKDEDEFVL
ncbi:MAG TPA: DivIVA domain-containing protein [bacterium]|nr:DivIVA domain-containing protein [bacterium]HPN45807.1 DivIVA domain-containing protein [bacterium]